MANRATGFARGLNQNAANTVQEGEVIVLAHKFQGLYGKVCPAKDAESLGCVTQAAADLHKHFII